MTDNSSQDLKNGDELIPADASSDCGIAESRTLAGVKRPRLVRFLVGSVLAAGVFVRLHTGKATVTEGPGAASVQRSSVLGSSEPAGRASLRELADTAQRRMTGRRLALLKDILDIRDSFAEPVDVNALLREIREDA